MRAFATAAILVASVIADGHLPHDDQFGLISPAPDMGDHDMDHHDMDHMDMDMDHMGDYDKMHRLEEMIMKFCDGLDEKMHDGKHDDMDHDKDWDKDHDMHDMDHDDEHHRMLAGHDDHDDEKDWDMMHHDDEKDWDKDHSDDSDSESDDDKKHRDHGHVKDMWLCMQAKQMAWDLKEYMHGDEHDKMRQSRGWMKDIKEMKKDWGMDGASNLAMAGAAMIVAVSALSF